MTLPPALVRRSLDAHSAIGLVVGALMYLICLTGTLAALAESFERWEQPLIEEMQTLPDAALSQALQQYRAHRALAAGDAAPLPESIWLILPTEAIPRMHLSDGSDEWFTDRQGNFLEPPQATWTEMLRHLHIKLLLPDNIGFTLVSALGVMLLALIISGLLAHPRLFRDAFKFRRGGARRLEQADLHNRLSVWGLPFHLMIAITGAFYGLVGVLVISAAAIFYGGDHNALFEEVYGPDPVLDAPVQAVDPARAMQNLRSVAPDASPLYLVVHNIDSRAQFMEIAAALPGRLAFSEIYRFDAAGHFLGDQGLTSGPWGRQYLYSLYRIHFGYFGGYLTRVIWALLGLSLTVVSATGVNIWLARRGKGDWADHAWIGVVWGLPAALAASALASLAWQLSPEWTLAAVWLGSLGFCLWRKSLAGCRQLLQTLSGVLMIGIALWHWLSFSSWAAVGDWINVGLLIGGVVLLVMGLRRSADRTVATSSAV
ncbi:MAG: PepSY-associated TM helix domain-containing protein [Pseudomonadota bacterium]